MSGDKSMPSKDDLLALSDWLLEDTQDLINSVLRKHTVAVLQEIRALTKHRNHYRFGLLTVFMNLKRSPDGLSKADVEKYVAFIEGFLNQGWDNSPKPENKE